MVRTAALALLLLAGCGGGDDALFTETRKIGKDIYAATADATAQEPAITAAAKQLCGDASHCTVAVFNEGSVLPNAFPLTDAEMPYVRGFYSLNRTTGLDEYKPSASNN